MVSSLPKCRFLWESRNNHFLRSIANQYKDHPSIVNIRHNALNNTHMDISSFCNDEVTPDKVNSIIKSLDANKASGTDKIPMKLFIFKLASDFLSKPFSKALNNFITSCTFPENAKVVTVVPINKKTDDKYVISNYRPVSLLNGFSKIYEIHLKIHLVSSMNQHIPNLVSAYRKNYSSQHVLIRLLEEWKKCLDNNYVVGGVLTDLSKAFDCVPHDLLIAKLEAYGINENLLAYLHSYLSNRKQCVRINNVTREFETIIPGVPQGSMGAQIDDQLNFNLHISNIFRSAANQLNALIRLKRFPAFEEKKTLINSYFYSNFSYCPLVWMFSSAKSLKKVASLQKIALRFLYDNCDSSYESLLKLARKSTMNVIRLRSLCIEILKR